jgi:hypothetical protein
VLDGGFVHHFMNESKEQGPILELTVLLLLLLFIIQVFSCEQRPAARAGRAHGTWDRVPPLQQGNVRGEEAAQQ